MASKALTYRIGADFGQMRREIEANGKVTRKLQKELAELEAQQREHRAVMESAGHGFMTFGAIAAAGFAVAGKAAIDWETAFTGVRKTVDGSDQEIAALEGQLRQLAKTLPATHTEIAAVAEAAGQLGIKRQDIAKFTKTMIDLGQTTNLTAEEAATGLAKISNIMGTSSKDVDRLGSALVALGNNGASTEKDIVDMALRIAGAGNQIGLTEGEVLGFASALSSVGIEAEAGGSSISRVMITMEQAVRSGGKTLDAFAKVAGVSGAEFRVAYQQDAAGAIATFVAGLSRMQKAGGDVFATLADLGFGEIIVRDALLRAAGASDLLTASLKLGNSAWRENSALAEEAKKRYETTASKIQIAWNQIHDALIEVGGVVAPIFADMASAIAGVVDWWQQLPGPIKEVVTWAGLAVTALALFGGAAISAVPKIMLFRETMRTVVSTGGAISGALGKTALALTGPWGAGISLALGLLGMFGLAQASAASEARQFTHEIDIQRRALTRSGVESLVKELRELDKQFEASVYQQRVFLGIFDTGGWDDVSLTFSQVAEQAGLSMAEIVEAITAVPGAWETVNQRVLASAIPDSVKQEFLDYVRTRGMAFEEALGTSQAAAGAAEKYAGAEEKAAAAAAKVTPEVRAQAEALGLSAVEAQEATDALNEMIKAFDRLNGVTLNFREAQRAWIESMQDAQKSLTENGRTLSQNSEKGRENARALDDMAKSAGELAEAAAREAEKTGGAAAANAAFTASLQASRPKLIEMARAYGMSAAEATAYANGVLGGAQQNAAFVPTAQKVTAELTRVRDAVVKIPPHKQVNVGVLSQEAIRRLRDLGYRVTTLPDGTVVVHGDTGPANRKMNELLRPKSTTVTVNLAVNSSGISRNLRDSIMSAHGNIVAFAAGGMHEDHSPQIARATPGTVRVWAEPETDRESYIPWAMDRRPRATAILAQTADGFGYALVPKSQVVGFAAGGHHGGAGSSTMSAFTGPINLVATLVDRDGSLIARVQGVAQSVVDAEGRNFGLTRGRR